MLFCIDCSNINNAYVDYEEVDRDDTRKTVPINLFQNENENDKEKYQESEGIVNNIVLNQQEDKVENKEVIKLIEPEQKCVATPLEFQQDNNIVLNNNAAIVYFTGYGIVKNAQKNSIELKKEARDQAMVDLAKNIEVKVNSECVNTINKKDDQVLSTEFNCESKTSSNFNIPSPDFWKEYFDAESCQLITKAFIIKDRVDSFIRLAKAESYFKQSTEKKYTSLEKKKYIEKAIMLLPYINFENLPQSLPSEYYEKTYQKQEKIIEEEIFHQRNILMLNPHTNRFSLEEAQYLVDTIQQIDHQTYYQNDITCRQINICFEKTKNQSYKIMTVISYKIDFEKNFGLYEGTVSLNLLSLLRESKKIILKSKTFQFNGVHQNQNKIDWKLATDKFMLKYEDQLKNYFARLKKFQES